MTELPDPEVDTRAMKVIQFIALGGEKRSSEATDAIAALTSIYRESKSSAHNIIVASSIIREDLVKDYHQLDRSIKRLDKGIARVRDMIQEFEEKEKRRTK